MDSLHTPESGTKNTVDDLAAEIEEKSLGSSKADCVEFAREINALVEKLAGDSADDDYARLQELYFDVEYLFDAAPDDEDQKLPPLKQLSTSFKDQPKPVEEQSESVENQPEPEIVIQPEEEPENEPNEEPEPKRTRNTTAFFDDFDNFDDIFEPINSKDIIKSKVDTKREPTYQELKNRFENLKKESPVTELELELLKLQTNDIIQVINDLIIDQNIQSDSETVSNAIEDLDQLKSEVSQELMRLENIQVVDGILQTQFKDEELVEPESSPDEKPEPEIVIQPEETETEEEVQIESDQDVEPDKPDKEGEPTLTRKQVLDAFPAELGRIKEGDQIQHLVNEVTANGAISENEDGEITIDFTKAPTFADAVGASRVFVKDTKSGIDELKRKVDEELEKTKSNNPSQRKGSAERILELIDDIEYFQAELKDLYEVGMPPNQTATKYEEILKSLRESFKDTGVGIYDRFMGDGSSVTQTYEPDPSVIAENERLDREWRTVPPVKDNVERVSRVIGADLRNWKTWVSTAWKNRQKARPRPIKWTTGAARSIRDQVKQNIRDVKDATQLYGEIREIQKEKRQQEKPKPEQTKPRRNILEPFNILKRIRNRRRNKNVVKVPVTIE